MSARSIRRTQERRAARERQRVRAKRVAAATGAAIGGAALLAPGANAANFPVTNTANAGGGSLRAAITSANGAAGPDSISFSGAGASGEIILATEIQITDDLTINGPGAGALSISGDSNNNNVRDFATSAVALGDTRIFSINDPTSPGSPLQNVTISGLTLKEGVADSFSGTIQDEGGGAIYSEQTSLSLSGTTFTDNASTEDGGAVFVDPQDFAGDRRSGARASVSWLSNSRPTAPSMPEVRLPPVAGKYQDDAVLHDHQHADHRQPRGWRGLRCVPDLQLPGGGGIHAKYRRRPRRGDHLGRYGAPTTPARCTGPAAVGISAVGARSPTRR